MDAKLNKVLKTCCHLLLNQSANVHIDGTSKIEKKTLGKTQNQCGTT
jgi:hypothetical protein